jgi:F-type H+-transporting ATPase subunit b
MLATPIRKSDPAGSEAPDRRSAMPRRPLALPAAVAGACAAASLLAPAVAHASEGSLQIIPDPTRLLVLLVLFAILVPVLNALLFQPLLRVLDEREQRIAGARTRAVELSQQTESLLARHEEALRRAREVAHAEQQRVVEAARGEHQSTIGEARHLAEGEIAAARTEIQRAVERVRASLGAEAEPIARDIAARLLGRSAG